MASAFEGIKKNRKACSYRLAIFGEVLGIYMSCTRRLFMQATLTKGLRWRKEEFPHLSFAFFLLRCGWAFFPFAFSLALEKKGQALIEVYIKSR